VTAGEVIIALEAANVELWLADGRVRWRRRGPVPRALLKAAAEHRDAIRTYLARRCEACGQSRPVMLLLDGDTSPRWCCARCRLGGAA
jgi:hypothetical protein